MSASTTGGDGSPNWLGLLQWSLAHQDGTAPTNATMMTGENQAWLEQVLKEGVVDEPKRMAQVIVFIKEHMDNNSLSTADVDMLEEVADITDQLDMAGVFVKLSGFKLIHEIVSSYSDINGTGSPSSLSEAIVVAALSLVGRVSQNNPGVQHEAITAAETGGAQPGGSLLDGIVRLVLSEVGHKSVAVQTKGLLAVSCIVRGDKEGEEVFFAKHYSTLFTDILSQHLGTFGDSNANNIISRLLFISKALLSSDYVSMSRLELVSNVVLPVCHRGIQDNDVNLKDCAIGLVNEYLRTVEGRAALSLHAAPILLALRTVEVCLNTRSAEATSDDDIAFIAEDLTVVRNLTEQLADIDNSAIPAGLGRILADKEETGKVMMLLGAPSPA